MTATKIAGTAQARYGIRTPKGWLTPTSGAGRFFSWSVAPAYPFRSEAGARHIAADWRLAECEVVAST